MSQKLEIKFLLYDLTLDELLKKDGWKKGYYQGHYSKNGQNISITYAEANNTRQPYPIFPLRRDIQRANSIIIPNSEVQEDIRSILSQYL